MDLNSVDLGDNLSFLSFSFSFIKQNSRFYDYENELGRMPAETPRARKPSIVPALWGGLQHLASDLPPWTKYTKWYQFWKNWVLVFSTLHRIWIAWVQNFHFWKHRVHIVWSIVAFSYQFKTSSLSLCVSVCACVWRCVHAHIAMLQ